VGDRPEGAYPRSYSDVVASRPASPARQSGGQNVVPVSRGAEREANVPVQRNQDTTFDDKRVVNQPASTSESSSEPEGENPNEWTTVQRRPTVCEALNRHQPKSRSLVCNCRYCIEVTIMIFYIQPNVFAYILPRFVPPPNDCTTSITRVL